VLRRPSSQAAEHLYQKKERKGLEYIDGNDFSMQDTCVAFGNFDGIHLGHKAVLGRLLEVARKGLTSVVVTFDLDESLMEGKKILSTAEEKKYFFGKNGPEVLVSYKVRDKDMDLKAFIRDILVGRLGAKVIVTGKDDKNIGLLRTCAKEYGYTLEECDTVQVDGEAVTSERIAEALSAQKLDKANELLGHPYLVIGEVMHGKALGRTVGMPTANIGYKPYKQLPADGVYGTISEIHSKMFKGLTNIGKRPSVDNFDYVTVEDFLLDFSEDIYGQVITLEVHALIRPVKKFNSLEEVKQQVNRDIESIRSYFEQLS
jgi:riboflavin kinase/FMN adenylyltransferase